MREEHDAEFRKKVQNYYFNLRERARDIADHYLKRARADADFRKNEEEIKATEIKLAKAEALGGGTSELESSLKDLKTRRAALLKSMNLKESMLVPQYRCKKCNDTGFDKDGNVCSCYKEFVENASDEKKLENILDVYSNIEL